MVNTFVQGTPVDFDQQTINGGAYTLPKSSVANGNFAYALVQFEDINDNYANKSRIAFFNREGGVVTNVGSTNGFTAGEYDQVIFTKEELNAGVSIINAIAFSGMEINIQYYKNN
jgi:hypothetical protein